MLAKRRWAAELLHFWFHRLGPGDWYSPDPAVDEALRHRFGRELAMLSSRPAREFLTVPQTALAAVLLFDQLPRNLHRGTAEAFAHDGLALAICHGALARHWERRLTREQRPMLGMPLMHSEAVADQRLALRYFARWSPTVSFPFARDHYRMVARFGRFPHRNEALGRASTPAEQRAIEAGFSW